MKKMLSFALVSIMILSITVFANDNEYITRAEATEKIVRHMYDLSYGEPFPIDMTYCMHQMRSMHFTPPSNEHGEISTFPLLASIYHATGWNGFTDFTDEHKNAIALNLAKEMGIINGMSNDMFCPDEPITFGQTVKMLVCALGYNDLANSKGGYPNGYIEVATEIGAMKNISFETDSLISPQQLEILLKDFFDLDYYPIKSVFQNMPINADECVNIYAEGVKSRNAMLQFAVFGSELKRQNRSGFEEMHWTTGTSSPWCTSYEIEKINDAEYNVTFFYAASDGSSGNMTVKLTTEQSHPVYVITLIEAVEE